jgi:hypothetical protein
MARTQSRTPKAARALRHTGGTRVSVPAAEPQSVVDAERAASRELRHPRNTDLDPHLVWRGKDYGNSGAASTTILFTSPRWSTATSAAGLRSTTQCFGPPTGWSRSADGQEDGQGPQERRRSWDTCGSPASRCGPDVYRKCSLDIHVGPDVHKKIVFLNMSREAVR